MSNDLKIDATPKQGRMLSELAGVDEVLWGGQAGGGKSEGLLLFCLLRRIQNAGSVGLALRKTFRELDKSLIRKAKFNKVWGLYAKWNEEKKLFQFKNGSIQEFGYLETDNDLLQYQSAEYDDVCFDELTHFPDNQYHYMKSRLRPRSCKKGLMRSATNPGNVGHQWVKDYFVDKARERVYKEWDEDVKRYKTRYFIPASLEDNTLMTAEQRAEYRSWLNQLPEAERRQLRDGDWDYVPGAAFAEWDSKVHVCEPMPVPEFGKIIMGFDFGFGKPFSVNWVWMDYDGRMWLFNEWYGWNGKPDQGIRMAPSGIARGILQREEQMKVRVYDRIADPSIFARTPNMKGGGQGPSIAEMMADEGVIFNPGDNDRLLGKAQLHERLKVPTDGLPMLMVYNNCHHFLRTFPVLQLDDNNIEDVETKMEDHAYDSIRYLCMSRPIVPQLAPRDKPFIELMMEKVTKPTPKDDFGLDASIYDL